MKALHDGVDLHLHTCYSDGLDTPTRVVEKAAQRHLGCIAITDHDTVEGLSEARDVGDLYGVEVVTGIELSVQFQEYDDLHILGYRFDPSHEELRIRLCGMQHHRIQRGLEILTRINLRLTQRGLAPLEREQVLQHAHGTLTRPHLAQELIAQGYVSNNEEAFRDFLIPCNVPKAPLGLEEAIALIAQAGGLCSLAHPGTLSTDPQRLETLLATCKDLGLAGVEVYHPAHYPTSVDFFLTCARRYDLMATGGSDSHGREYGVEVGEIAPGYAIPAWVLSELRRACTARIETP